MKRDPVVDASGAHGERARATSATAPIAETPVGVEAAPARYGSDAIAQTLRALDVPYLALNPGASYRGLHDSLVNFLGNERPQLLLCLHEESAVAIAQGYAKVTGRAMGVVLHSNVGLMHATMSIFNAWCDRVPMLILGATGPVDAKKRRPWIDWIHTASDQGALVRDFTKWDDQPGSIEAAVEAIVRAMQITATPPCAPVYVNLDAGMQEAPLASIPPLPDVARFAPPAPIAPDAGAVAETARRLRTAKRPLIMMGRVASTDAEFAQRIAFAERLHARVITDLKLPASFPTDHPLHAAQPGRFLAPGAAEALRDADIVLALDWVDLAGSLEQAFAGAPSCAIVNVSQDAQLARGFGKEHFGLAPADVYIASDPDRFVVAVDAALGEARASERTATIHAAADADAQATHDGAETADAPLTLATLAAAVNDATRDIDVCITAVPLGWQGGYRHFRRPLDYIGLEGGGGIGAGPGIAVGAALALKGSGRIPVAILGDGDFLMGVTALWTAVHYALPCLVIVANNRSFYNDELHQERVANARGRPAANKWIGQRIDDPAIDLAAMARAQGARGAGPVTTAGALRESIREALHHVRRGGVAVIDARVTPGAAPAVAAAPARKDP